MVEKQVNIKKKLVVKNVKDLIDYEKNNKKHWKNIKEISKSIKSNWYITPIIVNKDWLILAWHGRKKALEENWIKEVQVVQVDWLTEEQERDFRIRDNKLTELSEWDFDNLEIELWELKNSELSELFPNIELNVEWMDDSFSLPSWEKGDMETVTFTLHNEQSKKIKEAISIAKAMGDFLDTGNENSNWNAISRICEIFITQNK